MRSLLLFLFLSISLLGDIFPFQTIKKAKRAYIDGHYQQSVMLYRSLDSKKLGVLYNQANAEYKAGMYSSALKHYQDSNGVEEVVRLYNIGNVYFKMKKFKKAIAYYERALELKEDKDIRYNLALAKRKQKDKKSDDKKKDPKKEPKKEPKKPKKREKNEKRKVPQKKKKREEKEMTPEEKMRKKELSHLLNQLSKKRMPTLMYQTSKEQGVKNEQNPW